MVRTLHRAFVAVFPPEPVLEAILALRDIWEPRLPGLRWVAAPNLHFTLRFFGDLDDDQLASAVRVLDEAVSSRDAFTVSLKGAGTFPHAQRPRVFWLGAGEGGEALTDLARSTDEAFADAGLGRSDKRFVPHLTLGRWRDGGPPAPAEAACRDIGEAGSFTVSEAVLVESRLGPGGARYTPVHRASLRETT